MFVVAPRNGHILEDTLVQAFLDDLAAIIINKSADTVRASIMDSRVRTPKVNARKTGQVLFTRNVGWGSYTLYQGRKSS